MNQIVSLIMNRNEDIEEVSRCVISLTSCTSAEGFKACDHLSGDCGGVNRQVVV